MYGPDQLLLASKKPRIQELIRRSRSMSEDDIRALHEKPDVIRGLLLINLFGEEQKKATLAEKVADLMQRDHVDQPNGDEQSCQVFKIVSIGDGWLKTGSTLLEIKEGWYWAQLASGVIYLTNSPITSNNDTTQTLMSMSQHIGVKTLGEFKELERQRRNGLNASFILQLD
jgi:hypothetical protein